ncbi:MAG: hypothetical protein ABI432_09045 [Flavobacteriales bacterium]
MLIISLGTSAFAQRSPFNNLEVLPADSTGHYRILIGGHFHGESTNRSGYPAATLLANLDTINRLGANLFLSTGDLFMDAEKDRPRYERALFGKLNVPLFNAPGNHDMDRGLNATLRVGSFKMSSRDRVVLFDSEAADGSLSEDDLGILRFVQEEGASVEHVFIISHRPIWSEDDPQYTDLFKDNTRSVTGTNFEKDVYPILLKIAEHAHVYWISGSLGGEAPSSIFFQNHAKNITYIQCAIRDELRDALLIADVYPDTVKWSALSLTGQKLLAPEAYDAAWWRGHIGQQEGFNWRLLPYLIKTTVLRAEFWWGALVALMLAWLVRRLVRRGL